MPISLGDLNLPLRGARAGWDVPLRDAFGAMVDSVNAQEALTEAAVGVISGAVDANDATIAAAVTGGAATSAALNSTFQPKAVDGVYLPSSLAALKWRQARTQILAGDRQGHIAWLGDSIPFGAAGTGASNPKPEKCYPGRLRSILAGRHGDTGGGFTLANNSVLTNGAWDPRWAFSGTVTNQAFGPFKKSCYRIAAGGSYVEFTDVCDKFVVYIVPAGGASPSLISVSVDGVVAGTISNQSNYSGSPSLPRRSGYFSNTTQSHTVVDVPAGALGSHTLRISSGTTGDVFLVAVEAIVSTAGTFRVGNMSISGESLSSFGAGTANNDETNGLFGRPWIDTLRADLLVIALGINDWQAQRSLATVKTELGNLIARQRASGTSGGGANADGDAVLVWNPKPDTATLGGGAYTNPSWDAYRAAWYEAADQFDVPLLDFGDRWGGSYATANGLGLYADAIHPNDSGADDLAAGVAHALFNVI